MSKSKSNKPKKNMTNGFFNNKNSKFTSKPMTNQVKTSHTKKG